MLTEIIKKSKLSILITILFVVVFGVLSVLTYRSYLHLKATYAEAASRQLSAVGVLKSNQLIAWRKERCSDVQFFRSNKQFLQLVKAIVRDSLSKDARYNVLSWFKKTRISHAYDIFILDRDAKPRLAVSSNGDPLSFSEIMEISTKGSESDLFILDFQKSEFSEKTYLSFCSVLVEPSSGVPFGYLVLRVDPTKFLYPLIHDWPIQSKTAETLIVRQEVDSILFLNDLRLKRQANLSLKLAMKGSLDPAVMAVNGKVGIVDGIDYRGEPILAYVNHIPTTPWYLVAQMDKRELYGPAKEQLWLLISLLSLLFALGLIGLRTIFHLQSLKHYKEMYFADRALAQKEVERQQAIKQIEIRENRFRKMVEHSGDIILLVNGSGRVEYASPSVFDLLGNTQEEFLGTEPLARIHPDDLNMVMATLDSAIASPKVTFIAEHRMAHSDGRWLWITNKITNLLQDAEVASIIFNVTDITLEKAAEQAKKTYHKRLEIAQEIGQLGSWEYSIDDNMIWGSDEFFRIYGLDPTPGGLIDTKIIEGANPRYEIIEKAIQCLIENDEQFSIEHQINPLNSGEQRTVSSSAYLERNSAGKPLKINGVTHDITERKRFENALVESNKMLYSIVQTSPLAIVVTDIEGIVTQWNRSAENIFGWNEVEVVGKPLPLNPKEKLEEIERIRIKLRKGETFVGVESTRLKSDGSLVPIRFSSTAIFDEMSKPLAFLLIYEDITEKKNIEEELRVLNRDLEYRIDKRTRELKELTLLLEVEIAMGRTRQQEAETYAAEVSDLYNNAPCGYHSLDCNGLVVQMNDTELNWLGIDRSQVVGVKRFQEFLTETSLQKFQKNFPEFLAKGQLNDLEMELKTKSGAILYVMVNATAVYNDFGVYQFSRSTLFDIGDLKQTREHIVALNERLVSRAQSLEALNKEMEMFAYSVSHDLRAPLRAIEGFSRFLLEDYSDKLDADGNRHLEVIRTNTQKMDRLITDILTLSRITRTDLNNAEIDMTLLVKAVYFEVATEEEKKSFTFVVADLPRFFGDVNLMKQLWVNLISNALKYSSKSFAKIIEVGTQDMGTSIVYFIKDQGAGFNQEYAHRLFCPFQRLHNAEDFEGVGVGLAIVNRIVARHGGNVWAEGKVNMGATFCVEFPLGYLTK